ncbi:MAG: peptidoglycan-binding protein, partial [Rhodospirillaceae bacterium]|nr:peptidoglycan-binding protein [Rhodospirillaceae bacterium]
KGYYDGAVDGVMNASTLVALEACVREDCRLLADANP